MNRKQIIIFIVTILCVACVSSLCTAAIVGNNVKKRVYESVKEEKEYYKELLNGLDSFLEVKSVVDNNFVDGVKYDSLEAKLIEEYIKLLGDKYSDYFTKEELSAYMNKLSGSFIGIGITCTQKDGKIHIETVIEGSSAEESGIESGENIVSVEGVKVTEENYKSVIDSVLGEEGTFVTLGVEGKDGKVRSLSVERKKVVTPTVKGEILEGKIGYVIITQFASNTDEAFIETVDSLLEQGVKGFIFDVRNNSGGELNSVVNILDRLLPEGPIVNIIDGTGKKEIKYSTNEKKVELPMVVLINNNTASAAELFSAALRDYDMAELYGVTTYGKGYMQRIISLSDGSGIKLSIAKYNPPYGENYEVIGVSPDVSVEDNSETESDEQLEKAKNYFIK